MKRFILIASAIYFSCAAAHADDYLLRLDTIGFVDAPASEKDPKETIFRSIEVVVRPKSAFYSKVEMGTQKKLTLAGKLSPADDGGFHVQIRYAYSIEAGTTRIETIASIAVGEPHTIGGLEKKSSVSGKPTQVSKTRYVLVLAKYTDD